MSPIFDSLAAVERVADRKIYGVKVGTVTNNKDPEKMGRVKLKLPLRECENETDWARVATLMTGKQMGSFFLPEVGDEVLVAFHDGDIHKPFVIGMLWNSEDKPPLDNEDGKNNIRKIKSRSGNELIFDDESGNEKVTIKTKAGHTLTMEDQGKKIELKDSSGNNKLIINGANNEINLQSNSKLTIKAGSCKIEIDGMQNKIAIESPMQLNIKGQMVTIEAGASMDIKSSGILNIKGTMVKIN